MGGADDGAGADTRTPAETRSGPGSSLPPRQGTTTRADSVAAEEPTAENADDGAGSEAVQIEGPPTEMTGEERGTDATTSAGTDSTSDRTAADEAAVEEAAVEEAAAEVTDGDESGESATDSRSAPRPAGYRKLIRLLENREGAMPRLALRDLATNAYGMSEEAFEKVVEAAVENGDLEETDGGLQTA